MNYEEIDEVTLDYKERYLLALEDEEFLKEIEDQRELAFILDPNTEIW